jgi:hypothetical protein
MDKESVEDLIDWSKDVLAWFGVDFELIFGYFHSQNLISVKEK